MSRPTPVGIGIVVPFDFVLDDEYWAAIPAGVRLHVTRTQFFDGPVSEELAAAVSDEREVEQATRNLIVAAPAAVVYACTSGSFVAGRAGERGLHEAMRRGGATATVTTSGALVDALNSLGVRRLAVGTPYTPELGERLPPFLAEFGFEVVNLVNMGLEEGIGSVLDDQVVALADAAMDPRAEAVFLSCTNLPTLHLLAGLADRLGVPVLSANQVTMWAALRAANVGAEGTPVDIQPTQLRPAAVKA
jgi:maleate isomerase